MDADPELLTAGRFSDQTLLSTKALRLYAENGLLPPYRIDPGNGYRYYRADQVRTGWLIALLRGADMPLTEIAAVVRVDPAAALALVDAYASALDQRTEAYRFLLLRARQHLIQEDAMTEMTTVTSELLPDQPVLSLLRRTHAADLEDTIHDALAQLRAVATSAGLQEVGDAYGVFHEPVTDDNDGPIEIVLPVDRLADTDQTPGGEVRSYRMSGGWAASRTLVGPETDFPAILGCYDELYAWVEHTGHTRTGPPREIWHNSPRDAEPLRLTICWPYA